MTSLNRVVKSAICGLAITLALLCLLALTAWQFNSTWWFTTCLVLNGPGVVLSFGLRRVGVNQNALALLLGNMAFYSCFSWTVLRLWKRN